MANAAIAATKTPTMRLAPAMNLSSVVYDEAWIMT
jgi:hypothetical protein